MLESVTNGSKKPLGNGVLLPTAICKNIGWNVKAQKYSDRNVHSIKTWWAD